ncbi:MAG: Na+/H+ antiporter subunit D [Candidatus Electrothrix sp. Rat3]|nr:Na+/H+ antiporter subunit D [Candidatus Electrothrix rattekaaiensis]
MNIFVLLPILIPLITTIGVLLARQRPRLRRNLSLGGAGLLLIIAVELLVLVWRDGIQVIQVGEWAAPFGITLVADLFSAMMVLLAALMGLGVIIYSRATAEQRVEHFGYSALLHFILMGVNGAFLTGDMFNLYVWFELLLIASFVLLVLGGRRDQLEGTFKYVAINLFGSILFLVAVGILYGVAGTLNMADLADQLNSLPSGLVTTLAMLFLVAFGIKAGAFPLFFWLPASYHTAPAALLALFAGLMTKVGVYALVRVFTLFFTQDTGYTHTLILIIAGFTMVTGVLGAVAQTEFRKLLSFHIISQIGYLLMGLGLFSTAALGGAVYFMVHVILAKSALFLVGGIIYKLRGTYNLKQLGGLSILYPGLALLFLIPALSLAGIPPLSGFWAKFALVQAGLAAEQYVIVAVSLGVSLLTLFSMTKIWAEVFWKDQPGKETPVQAISFIPHQAGVSMLLPVGALAAILVVIGLLAEPLVNLSLLVAGQLLNPADYIETVLGGVL